MPEDEIVTERKESIKKELIQEIRALSKDESFRKRVEEGLLGDAEKIKGSILTTIVKGFDSLENTLETSYAKSRQVEDLETRIDSMEAELFAMKNILKDFNVRIIETLESNFKRQMSMIDAIPLPLERAVREIPGTVQTQVADIRNAVSGLNTNLAEITRLNADLRSVISEMQSKSKEFNDAMRHANEALDIHRTQVEEKLQAVQNKMDKVSVAVDEKTLALRDMVKQSAMKLGTFEASIMTMCAGMTAVEAKIEGITKKIEMLGATIIGIEALDEFVKSIEKKIDAEKIDLTGLEADVKEIKSQLGIKGETMAGTPHAGLEESVQELQDQLEKLSEKFAKTTKDIISRINTIQRTIEMQ